MVCFRIFARAFAAACVLSVTGLQASAVQVSRDIDEGTDLVQLWNDTGFGLDSVRQDFFNDEDCKENAKTFAGCMAALEVFFSGTEYHLVFGSAKGFHPPVVLGNLVTLEIEPSGDSTFIFWEERDRQQIDGEVSLVRFSVPEDPDRLRVNDISQAMNSDQFLRSSLDEFWVWLYQNYAELVDFGLLFDQVAEKVVPIRPEGEPQWTAEAFNAYLWVCRDHKTRVGLKVPDKFLHEDFGNHLGIEFDTTGSRPRVKRIMPGSVGERRGVQVGEYLLEINGKSVRRKSWTYIEELSLSQTEAVFKFSRGLSISIPRSTIDVGREPYVHSLYVPAPGINIGYIHLGSFGFVEACDFVKQKIDNLERMGAQSIILDIRYNPGGKIKQLVCIADLFLPRGEVLFQEFDLDSGKMSSVHSRSRAQTRLNLAVLVNGDSFSAADYFPGAIQDTQRGWIVGQPTGGKHSIQETIVHREWFFGLFHSGFHEGMFLKKSVSRVFRASGETYTYGVKPDFLVFDQPIPPEEQSETTVELTQLERILGNEYQQRLWVPLVDGAPEYEPGPARSLKIAGLKECVGWTGTALSTYEKNVERHAADVGEKFIGALTESLVRDEFDDGAAQDIIDRQSIERRTGELDLDLRFGADLQFLAAMDVLRCDLNRGFPFKLD